MKTNKLLHSLVGLSLAGNLLGGVAVHSLSDQKEDLTKVNFTLEREKSILQSSINGKNDIIETLEVELDWAKKDVEALNGQLKSKDAEITQLKGNIKKLESTVSKLKTEVQPSVNSRSVGKVSANYNANSNVSGVSGITAAQLDKAFQGRGLAGLGSAFINAESKYGVNAIFLAAIAVEESGWGESNHARNKNNLFGIASGAVGFSSKGASIEYAAKLLSNNYLKPGGKYYNGATPAGVNVYYCEGTQWRHNIASVMNTLVRKMNK